MNDDEKNKWIKSNKGRRCLNLTGKKFGKLTVIKMLDCNRDNKRGMRWLCKCECGKEKEVLAARLVYGEVASCGDSSHRSGELNYGWKGCGQLSGHYFNSIERSAKVRNLDFSVQIEYLWNLFLEQDKKCAYTKIILEMNRIGYSKNATASLDRIDSSKGYIPGNVQWVHKNINALKSDFSHDEFILLCKLVAKK